MTGILAASWNDNPERELSARIAKFLVLVIMVSMAIFFMALMLNSSACTPRR